MTPSLPPDSDQERCAGDPSSTSSATLPGNLPPDNLTEAAQQYIDRKLGRRDRALAAADESAETAVAFITEVRERTGAGPTWTELTRACGVPATSTEWFVTRLHTNGIVTSTSEQRSLRVKIRDDEPAG